jgi:hypothetical protein
MVRILTLAVRDLGSNPGRSAKREVTKVLSTGGQEPSVSGFDSHLLDKIKILKIRNYDNSTATSTTTNQSNRLTWNDIV